MHTQKSTMETKPSSEDIQSNHSALALSSSGGDKSDREDNTLPSSAGTSSSQWTLQFKTGWDNFSLPFGLQEGFGFVLASPASDS